MRVIIYEAGRGGHFLVFARYLVDGVLARGGEPVLLLSRQSAESEEFRMHLGGFGNECEVRILSVRPTFGALQTMCRDLGGDRLIVPNGAVFAYSPAALIGHIRVATTVLVLRDPALSALGVRSVVKRAVLRLLELRSKMQVKRLVLTAGPVQDSRYVPDPVDVTDMLVTPLVRRVIQWRGARTLFLVSGVIAPWKNPLMTVEAFARASLPSSCLAFVGPVVPELKDALSRAVVAQGGSVLLVDQLLLPGEMNALIAESHAVVMAYDVDVANSTSAKAAALGVGIVAAGSPSFLKNVSLLGIDREEASLEVDAVKDALVRAAVREFRQDSFLPDVDDFKIAMLDA